MATSLSHMDAHTTGTSRPRREYSRILTAAVINSRFRQMLLSNPGKAVSTGYAGEAFHLPHEEKKRLASIRATSLADFASQLTHANDTQGIQALSIGD